MIGAASTGYKVPTQPRHTQPMGYRAKPLAKALGISYRQLDYWTRTGIIKPTTNQGTGPGNKRLYDNTDITHLLIITTLINHGTNLDHIRTLPLTTTHLPPTGYLTITPPNTLTTTPTPQPPTTTNTTINLQTIHNTMTTITTQLTNQPTQLTAFE